MQPGKTTTTTARQFLYNSEEIKNISALGDVLREIRARLIREGVSIEKQRKKLVLAMRKGHMLKYKPYAKRKT